jgi:hypothetical protein
VRHAQPERMDGRYDVSCKNTHERTSEACAQTGG